MPTKRQKFITCPHCGNLVSGTIKPTGIGRTPAPAQQLEERVNYRVVHENGISNITVRRGIVVRVSGSLEEFVGKSSVVLFIAAARQDWRTEYVRPRLDT